MAGRAKPGQPKSPAKQTVGKRVGRGAGKGDGWGGPAKGEGGPAFIEGKAIHPLQGKVHKSRDEREAALTAHLEYLALNAEREETQVSATVHALNRLVGMPIQRQDVTSGGDKMPAIQIITGVPRGDDA